MDVKPASVSSNKKLNRRQLRMKELKEPTFQKTFCCNQDKETLKDMLDPPLIKSFDIAKQKISQQIAFQIKSIVQCEKSHSTIHPYL